MADRHLRGRTAGLAVVAAVGMGVAVSFGADAGAARGKATAGLRASDVLSLKARLSRYDEALPDAALLGMGRIAAYEENELFAYVAGGGPALQRRVAFLKPDTLVVDDHLSGPAARWMLHSAAEPKIDGPTARLSEGGAEIMCRTLLPKGAALKASRGGKGDAGGWATAVVPKGKAGLTRVLHVISVGPKAGAEPKCELSEGADGATVLKVATAGRTFELTLPAKPDEIGKIAAAGADGKVLLAKQMFPAGIMPHGADGVKMMQRWDRAYQRGRTPGWDVGRPATELKRLVEAGTIKPGRAVVLGCGTGTNAIYLAQKGFDVTGIDVAPTGLARAEAKARKAGVRVRWLVADVLAAPEIGPFDFVFDRGCYHHVRRIDAAGFAKTVRRLTKPGSRVLILAASANETRRGGPPRVKESEIRGDFSSGFEIEQLGEIHFDSRDPKRSGPMAWSILLRRKGRETPTNKGE